MTQVLPSDGPTAGGTSIEVIGTGFTGATEVEFGSTDLFLAGGAQPAIATGTTSLTFTLVSSTLITLNDPAGTGVVDVRVTTPVATSAITAADRFTYKAPATTPPTTTTTPPTTSTTTTTPPVVAVAFPSTPAGPSSSSSSGPSSGGLAFTGLNLAPLLFGSLMFTGLGALLVMATRRNRKGRHARP